MRADATVLIFLNIIFMAKCLPIEEIVEGNAKVNIETISVNDIAPNTITVNGQPYKEVVTSVTEHPPGQIPDTSAPHNMTVGERIAGDRLFYTDNTALENSGPSTINGTISINIDAKMNITRVEAWDQVPDGFGAFPTLEEGGPGHNHITLRLRTQYSRGFHFLILVFGVNTYKMDPDGIVENALEKALEE